MPMYCPLYEQDKEELCNMLPDTSDRSDSALSDSDYMVKDICLDKVYYCNLTILWLI